MPMERPWTVTISWPEPENDLVRDAINALCVKRLKAWEQKLSDAVLRRESPVNHAPWRPPSPLPSRGQTRRIPLLPLYKAAPWAVPLTINKPPGWYDILTAYFTSMEKSSLSGPLRSIAAAHLRNSGRLTSEDAQEQPVRCRNSATVLWKVSSSDTNVLAQRRLCIQGQVSKAFHWTVLPYYLYFCIYNDRILIKFW